MPNLDEILSLLSEVSLQNGTIKGVNDCAMSFRDFDQVFLEPKRSLTFPLRFGYLGSPRTSVSDVWYRRHAIGVRRAAIIDGTFSPTMKRSSAK